MKKKRGRPFADDPANNLSETLAFRLTKSEAEQCTLAAEKASLSLTKWLRNRVAKAAKRESKRD